MTAQLQGQWAEIEDFPANKRGHSLIHHNLVGNLLRLMGPDRPSIIIYLPIWSDLKYVVVEHLLNQCESGLPMVPSLVGMDGGCMSFGAPGGLAYTSSLEMRQ